MQIVLGDDLWEDVYSRLAYVRKSTATPGRHRIGGILKVGRHGENHKGAPRAPLKGVDVNPMCL